jgi:predicted N-acyltransferase
MTRVEAGAQGQHKIQRGYLPTATYSTHFITDPALRRAVADHLTGERRAVAHEIELLAEESPYRQENNSNDPGAE